MPFANPVRIEQGVGETPPQQAGAHRGCGPVEGLDEGGAGRAARIARQRAEEFQVPLGQVVNLHAPGGVKALETAEVVQLAALRLGEIADRGPRRAGGGRHVLDAERFEGECPEVAAERVAGVLGREPHIGTHGEQRELSQCGKEILGGCAFRDEQLTWAKAGHRLGAFALPVFRDELRGGEVAGREVHPGRPQPGRPPGSGLGHDHEVGGFRSRQIGRIEIRRRGSDPHDLPPDGSLRETGRLHLFTDRHPDAGAHEARDVSLGGVVRDARHRNRLSVGIVLPGGDRDPEEFAGLRGVLEEDLVEVAHPEEQHRVAGLLLELEVLLHHGRDAAPLRLPAPRTGGRRGRRRLQFGEEPRDRGHAAIVSRS